MSEARVGTFRSSRWRIDPRAGNIWNFASFQIVWFALAFTAKSPRPETGVALAAMFLAGHAALRRDWRQQALLLLAAGGIGAAVDSAVVALGVFRIVAPNFPSLLGPVWFFAFYANFASTLPASLAWLAPRPLLAALLGAGGGPLAYYSGAKLGPIALGEPQAASLLALAILWAALTPFFFSLARRLRALD